MVDSVEEIAAYLNYATDNIVSQPTDRTPGFYGVVTEYTMPDDFDSTSFLTLALEKSSNDGPVIIHDGSKTYRQTHSFYKGSKVNERRTKTGEPEQYLYLPVTKENVEKQIRKLSEVILTQLEKSIEH